MKKLAVISSLFVVSSLMGATYNAPSSTTAPVSPSPTTSTIQNTPMGTPVNTNPTSPSGQTKSIQSPSGNSYLSAARPIEAEKVSPIATTPEAKDRFTSTEDHKLGSQIRVQIAEIIGAPKAGEIFLVIDSGDVKLLGKVPTEESKAKIVSAIHQMKNVKSINNKLEVTKK